MKIALVGIGKIARDQHIPALHASVDWELAAAVSRSGDVEGVETFVDVADLLAARPDIETLSLCLPPAPRVAVAAAALEAGRHVMLEKPPACSVADARGLAELAASRGGTLYATWHSRMAQGVAAAKEWLADKTIDRAKVVWREDVRKWHPSQEWVFEPGGMGIFDPGINGLSILTEILPVPTQLISANLDIPANRAMPIAAQLELSGGISVEMDWRQTKDETWTVVVDTPEGRLELRNGGHVLLIDGQPIDMAGSKQDEYPALYARMAQLVRGGESDCDFRPLAIVEDALNKGVRRRVEPFTF